MLKSKSAKVTEVILMKKSNLLFKIMMLLLLISFSLLLSGARSEKSAPDDAQSVRQIAIETAKSISHGSSQQKWQHFAEQEPMLLINLCSVAD